MNLAIIYPTSETIAICYPMEGARQTIVVTPAVMEPRTMPAVIDETGNVVQPAIPLPPVEVTPAVTRQETDAEFAARIAPISVPNGVPYRIIPRSDIPTDRSERALWTAEFTTYDGIGAAA